VEGVHRWICTECGSPLMASFDYIPDQIFVPLGVLDDPEAFPPQIHCHTSSKLSWLHLSDDLPREAASARGDLRKFGDL